MSLLRRSLLRRLVERGAPLNEIEATIARARAEGRELTVTERVHLSKLRWAEESGYADAVREDLAEARVARAEQWLGWDQAPPASDDWLLRPDEDDESWLRLYDRPAPAPPTFTAGPPPEEDE